MRDRRQRILSEVRKLLMESPVDGFTMRDIGRRAGVAHRTLYNMFGSKEDVIVNAIEEHFLDVLAEAPPPMSPDLLPAALRHIEIRSHQVLGLKAYAVAILNAYFSPTIDHRMHDSLLRLSRIPWDFWIDQAQAARLIRPISSSERELTMSLMTNAAYSNISDLLSGRVSSEQYVARGKITFLFTVLPFINKRKREAADALMTEQYEAYPTLPGPDLRIEVISGEPDLGRGRPARREAPSE
jgi:TetR/AcrR family transcriptional repressor of uid operon